MIQLIFSDEINIDILYIAQLIRIQFESNENVV